MLPHAKYGLRGSSLRAPKGRDLDGMLVASQKGRKDIRAPNEGIGKRKKDPPRSLKALS